MRDSWASRWHVNCFEGRKMSTRWWWMEDKNESLKKLLNNKNSRWCRATTETSSPDWVELRGIPSFQWNANLFSSQFKFYHRLIVYQFRRSKRESKENLRSESFFFFMRSPMIVNFYLWGCIRFTPFYLFPFSVRSCAYCVGAALGSFIMIDMVDPGWKVAKFSEELLE